MRGCVILKKILFFICCTIFVVLVFSSCSKKDVANLEGSIKEPTEVVENFFSAFEKANYESMETFCTKACVDRYFHEGDVFGMVWAKTTEIGEILDNPNEKECGIFVDVEMETAKTSALYPETETSFYVVLKNQSDETWLIDSFVTGYY